MYILYKQTSNLGLTIPADSLDIDTLQILHDFESKVVEVRDKVRNQKAKRKR